MAAAAAADASAFLYGLGGIGLTTADVCRWPLLLLLGETILTGGADWGGGAGTVKLLSGWPS